MNVQTGARKDGAVRHYTPSGSDTAFCGRMVIPGIGSALRSCKTCIRVNNDAWRMDRAASKAVRDAQLVKSANEPITQAETWSSYTYELNEVDYNTTLEKIAKINARCEKRGLPGMLTVTLKRWTQHDESFGMVIERKVFETTITGIPMKFDGWRFVATLEWDRNAGLIVRNYPGVVSVDRSNLRNGWCDHCQTTRYRTRTYVVQNLDTGECVQVGSSCIKDFTGWTALPYNPDDYGVNPESEGWYSGERADASTLSVLAVAWACVKTYGYVRSSEAGSTKDMVMKVIYPPSKISDKLKAELTAISEHASEMYEKAIQTRAFILSDDFRGDSDFVFNMKSLMNADRLSSSNYGTACYAPEAWARFNEKSLIRKAETLPSVHMGELKERLKGLSVKVMSLRYVDTAFGLTTIINFMEECGNVYTWFASESTNTEWLTEGETVVIDGTVKAHKEFKGIPQTVLKIVKQSKA
jgi:hypothetical protein